MDGRWMGAEADRFRVQTPQIGPSLFDHEQDPSGIVPTKATTYVREALDINGRSFHLYIPEGLEPEAAFTLLLDGYTPKKKDR